MAAEEVLLPGAGTSGRIVVTGATDKVGHVVVQQLLAAGRSVRAAVRSAVLPPT